MLGFCGDSSMWEEYGVGEDANSMIPLKGKIRH